MLPPRRFMPSLSSLLALEALDRLGSASAVAEELSLTQSAVSRQLQALEQQLGTDLIRRDKKRLSLSPDAKEYVQDVRAALGQIAKASLKVQAPFNSGSLHLAILPAFGMRWLMPRLPEFARLFPDVTINMSTQLQEFDFSQESYDAALHFGAPGRPGVQSLLLKHEHMIPVCAPSLLNAGEHIDPTQIAALPLMQIQTRPRAWPEWFKRIGVDPERSDWGTIYDQFATMTQAAVHGLGVALMPDYLVEQDLATGRLVQLYPEPIEAEGQYYLIWPDEKSDAPALMKFRDWLATQAQPEDVLPR
ncbi:MAG: LysR family transcriptional regulator [Paracoccaceae bacterium]